MPNAMDRFTAIKLKEFGLEPDMKVLDFGCGPGVTTFLLADIVGEYGQVVGFDINLNALDKANATLKGKGLSNVSFQGGSLATVAEATLDFDFVFGRRVLMYIPEAIETLTAIRKMMRPGASIVFQEHAMNEAEVMSELPLHEKIRRLTWETVRREGGNIAIGGNLWEYFNKSGFDIPYLEGVANLFTPDGSSEYYSELMRIMSDRMIKQNLIIPGEFDPELIDEDLIKERRSSSKTYVSEVAYWIHGINEGQ